MKRKTTTSCEVKDRWNREHYDKVTFRTPTGGAEELRKIAESRGMSVAAYLRHLVIADNAQNPESTCFLRGGGVADAWEREERYLNWMRNIIDGVDVGQLSFPED